MRRNHEPTVERLRLSSPVGGGVPGGGPPRRGLYCPQVAEGDAGHPQGESITGAASSTTIVTFFMFLPILDAIAV